MATPRRSGGPWAAGELRSHLIHSGHHQAEQAPDELAPALLRFLGPDNGQNPRFGQSL
jgi:haloacetate dehalogenase